MATIEELDQKFDISELGKQLESVVASKDPVGYMKNNINWEIDKDLDDDHSLISLTKMMGDQMFMDKGYDSWNPFSKFLTWLNKNKAAKTVKRVLCNIATEIQKLIDEKAELEKILKIALTAIIGAIGLGAINAAILTLVVGFLATMILKGVENVCAS